MTEIPPGTVEFVSKRIENPELGVYQVLKIRCPNGYVGYILVSEGPARTIGNRNIWHFEIKDGKITLTGVGMNSVKMLNLDGTEACHETITDWPIATSDGEVAEIVSIDSQPTVGLMTEEKPERTDKKPRLCPDQGCQFIIRNESDEWFDKGGSFDCFGYRGAPFEYKFREVLHTNDLNHCIFCPSGIFNLKENVGDLSNMASLYLRVLVERGQKVFNPAWYLKSHVEIDKHGLLYVNDERRGKWHCCWHHGTCTRDVNPGCNGTWEERGACPYWKEVGGL